MKSFDGLLLSVQLIVTDLCLEVIQKCMQSSFAVLKGQTALSRGHSMTTWTRRGGYFCPRSRLEIPTKR